MKKSLLLIFFTLLAFFTVAVTTVSAATIHKDVKSCTRYSQYFKFLNTHTAEKLAIFTVSKNQNVNTTLSSYNPLPPGDSDVFVNKFTADNQAILAGNASLMGHPLFERLCTIEFACTCSEAGCAYDVTTIGPRCNIDGDGTQVDPYVLNLR